MAVTNRPTVSPTQTTNYLCPQWNGLWMRAEEQQLVCCLLQTFRVFCSNNNFKQAIFQLSCSCKICIQHWRLQYGMHYNLLYSDVWWLTYPTPTGRFQWQSLLVQTEEGLYLGYWDYYSSMEYSPPSEENPSVLFPWPGLRCLGMNSFCPPAAQQLCSLLLSVDSVTPVRMTGQFILNPA